MSVGGVAARAQYILRATELEICPSDPQSLRNPLIKEYTLNHIRDPTIIKVYFLIKGY